MVATDGILTYAIFIYKCGDLNWIGYSYASIGFNIGPDAFASPKLSLTPSVNNISCLNGNTSEWSNVVYCVGGCDDICEAANPCKNGGVCTINSSVPSNFACNCTGTGYNGDTCEGIDTIVKH